MIVGAWDGLQHGLNGLGGDGEFVLLKFIDVFEVQDAPVLKGGWREVRRGVGKVRGWSIVWDWGDVSAQN